MLGIVRHYLMRRKTLAWIFCLVEGKSVSTSASQLAITSSIAENRLLNRGDLPQFMLGRRPFTVAKRDDKIATALFELDKR
jgi:hypothetical protein